MSTGADLRKIIEEMRTIALVAGQCAAEGPGRLVAPMALAEAERASNWADRLDALLTGAPVMKHDEDETQSRAERSPS